MRAGFGVDAVDVLVVFDQRCDSLRSELEGDLMLGDHIDVYNVCFNVDHLVVEKTFNERIRVFDEL